MSRKAIKTSSVTYAVKGKELLINNGYKAYISRNSHPGRGEGCGYVIFVSNYDERCLKLLEKGGIKITGVENSGVSL